MLARRQREGLLTAHSATRLANVFLFHAERQYLTVPMDLSVLVAARNLTITHPLRALDAIQLASALHASTTLNTLLTFITADKNLLAAATAEGLTTDDPTAHP